MKFMILVLLLMLVFLFYPFHDLYVKDDPFLPDHSLLSRGFWSEEACREAAEAQRAIAYRCVRGSSWERMFGAAVSYGHDGGSTP